MENQEFVKKLKDDLTEIHEEQSDVLRLGDLFTIWFIKNIILGGSTTNKAYKYFIGGSKEDKLDIGIADEDYELVVLGQTKFPHGEKQITDQVEINTDNSYNKDLIDEIIIAKTRLKDSPNTGSQKRQDFVVDYNGKIAKDESNLTLIAVGFGRFTPDALEYATKKGVDVYDFETIKREYEFTFSPEGQSFTEPTTLPLTFKGGNSEYGNEEFKTYSYFIDANSIAKAVETYGEGLFIEDIRHRLEGGKRALASKIAKDIRDTTLKTPEQLSVLNNGITIVCEKRNPKTDNTLELIKPKIVNGCQTSWALYDAYKTRQKEGKTLSAYISARIIETKKNQYIEKITKSTNNQNPINERDKRSLDPYQKAIHTHFANSFKPAILYDYRAGLVDSLRKADGLGKFSVARRRGSGRPPLRSIDNVFAGQLYLALLGSPIIAKTKKKEIFEDDKTYNTVFNYDLPRDERFSNDRIGITPTNVKLNTGLKAFCEDIFFANAVYQFADAYSDLYGQKVDLYSEGDKTTHKLAYDLLVGDFSFLKRWQYIVVASVNYIVNTLSKGNETEREKLRKLLIVDRNNSEYYEDFWSSTALKKKLNFNPEKNVADILKEDAPSVDYPIMAKWLISISLLLKELVDAKKNDLGAEFDMRRFIELSTTPYDDLTVKIGKILALTSTQKEKFPTSIRTT